MVWVRSGFSALGAALLLVVAASPVGAAVVVGSSLQAIPTGSTCLGVGAPVSCTLTIDRLPESNEAPGGLRAPLDGVVVRWAVKGAAVPWSTSLALRVVDGTTGGGRGALETLPAAGGVHEFDTRVPIGSGDAIGLDDHSAEDEAAPVTRDSATGASFSFWLPPLGVGESRAPVPSEPDRELLVNATIEPDADDDGWGDETQDACPGASGGSAGCPLAAASTSQAALPPLLDPVAAPPGTTIKRGPKAKIDRPRATFTFSSETAGTAFHCKLDKKPWKPCKSPKTYRGLKGGRHKFQVRAAGPTGLIDPTPAKRSFEVER